MTKRDLTRRGARVHWPEVECAMDGERAFHRARSPRAPRTSQLHPPSAWRNEGPLAAAQERLLAVASRTSDPNSATRLLEHNFCLLESDRPTICFPVRCALPRRPTETQTPDFFRRSGHSSAVMSQILRSARHAWRADAHHETVRGHLISLGQNSQTHIATGGDGGSLVSKFSRVFPGYSRNSYRVFGLFTLLDD